jgi:hypothetical protein
MFYAVIADRFDFRLSILIPDVLGPAYREFSIVEIGLTVRQADALCQNGEENKVQADLRLRERRIARARSR